MNKTATLLFAAVAAAGSVGAAIAGTGADLPPDVKVIAPGPDVPKELAEFSGIWAGDIVPVAGYDSFLNSPAASFVSEAIAVERIGMDSATVVRAWGRYHSSKGTDSGSPGWSRKEGTVSNGAIMIEQATLRLLPGDKLQLEWRSISGTKILRGVLTRAAN